MTTEADWTAPTERCPRPDWWHAPDPDSAEDEIADFLWGLVRALQPEVVAETGTAHARTATRLVDALEANGHGHLVTYEADAERAARCTEILAGRPATVHAVSSLDSELRPVDLLFSDSHPHVRVAEVEAFAPTWFVLHDTAPHHPWANRLDRDLRRLRRSYRWVELHSPRGALFGQRFP